MNKVATADGWPLHHRIHRELMNHRFQFYAVKLNSACVRKTGRSPNRGLDFRPPLFIGKSAKASSTILTVGCQRIKIQSIYKDVLQCPRRTPSESKL